MNERILQFRVGVMVLATLLITAILVLLFTEPISLHTYKVYIKFSEAPGVTRYTPIRKSGIRIGRVTDVRFVEDDTKVLITAEIESDRRIYHNEMCQAVGALLVGDSSLEFVPSPNTKALKTPVAPGETIEGQPASDPTRTIASLQDNLVQAMRRVNTAGDAIESAAGRLDRLLEANEQRISKTIADADVTFKAMEQAFKHVDDILGDANVRSQLKESIAEMPKLLKDTRSTVDGMGTSMHSLGENLHNLEGLTEPLGKRGAILVQRIDDSTAKLDRLMDKLLHFSEDLNDPKGSLGRLAHDPELYRHLNHAAKNIEELSQQLKPILNDARIFSDKIARHPETLGVRGAIQRNQGMK